MVHSRNVSLRQTGLKKSIQDMLNGLTIRTLRGITRFTVHGFCERIGYIDGGNVLSVKEMGDIIRTLRNQGLTTFCGTKSFFPRHLPAYVVALLWKHEVTTWQQLCQWSCFELVHLFTKAQVPIAFVRVKQLHKELKERGLLLRIDPDSFDFGMGQGGELETKLLELYAEGIRTPDDYLKKSRRSLEFCLNPLGTPTPIQQIIAYHCNMSLMK